jgi:hypothetical protein
MATELEEKKKLKEAIKITLADLSDAQQILYKTAKKYSKQEE